MSWRENKQTNEVDYPYYRWCIYWFKRWQVWKKAASSWSGEVLQRSPGLLISLSRLESTCASSTSRNVRPFQWKRGVQRGLPSMHVILRPRGLESVISTVGFGVSPMLHHITPQWQNPQTPDAAQSVSCPGFEVNSQRQWRGCSAAGPAAVFSAAGWGCASRASMRQTESGYPDWKRAVTTHTDSE